MARKDPIRCEVHEIIIPPWDKLTAEQKRDISRAFQESTANFFGEESSRRGFTGINQSSNGDIIIGFYVQEDLRQGLEGSSPGALRPNTRANFEKLFFAFVINEGHIVIQRTTVSGYVAMNYTTMRRDFEQTLLDVMKSATVGVSQIQLRKFYRQRTQEEMYSIFVENVIDEIVVTDLEGKNIREEVQLSNPDPSEEIMLKRIFNGDFQRIEAETIKAAERQDLRKTKSAKAAVGAGHTEKIVVRRSTDDTETFYTEQDEKLDLPIDDQKSEMDSSDMNTFVEIYERKIKIPASKFPTKTTDLGPLFTWNQSQDE